MNLKEFVNFATLHKYIVGTLSTVITWEPQTLTDEQKLQVQKNIGVTGGGGGGSSIDDDTISALTTWSSQKINAELGTKATVYPVTLEYDSTYQSYSIQKDGVVQTFLDLKDKFDADDIMLYLEYEGNLYLPSYNASAGLMFNSVSAIDESSKKYLSFSRVLITDQNAVSIINFTSENKSNKVSDISSWTTGTDASAYPTVDAVINYVVSALTNKANLVNGTVPLTELPEKMNPTDHNHESKDINKLTGYTTQGITAGALAPTDTLNQALGKLEKDFENANTMFKIKKESTPDTGFAATYQLYYNVNGGTYNVVSGSDKIQILKDNVVTGGEVKYCETPDVPVPGYVVGDAYIDFTLNTDPVSHLYVLVTDLLANTALQISYDNTESGLQADNVQAAIDEIVESIPDITNCVTSSFNDKAVTSTYSSSGVAPVNGQAVASAISDAIGDLDKAALAQDIAPSKTIKNYEEQDGIVSVETQDIAIGSDQVTSLHGYQKSREAPQSTALGAQDTMNQALNKLEHALDGKLNDANYAGSSSKGGSATKALALDVNNTAVGSATKGVYIDSNGIPQVMTYSLKKDVNDDAQLTDTTYTIAEGTTNGNIKYKSSGDSQYTEVPVHGLGTAAYKAVATSPIASGDTDLPTSDQVYNYGVAKANISTAWTNNDDNDHVPSTLLAGKVFAGSDETTPAKGLVPAPTKLGAGETESKYLRADGEWEVPTDNKVTQTNDNTTANSFGVLFANTPSSTTTETNGVKKSADDFKYNPSTKTLAVPKASGFIDTATDNPSGMPASPANDKVPSTALVTRELNKKVATPTSGGATGKYLEYDNNGVKWTTPYMFDKASSHSGNNGDLSISTDEGTTYTNKDLHSTVAQQTTKKVYAIKHDNTGHITESEAADATSLALKTGYAPATTASDPQAGDTVQVAISKLDKFRKTDETNILYGINNGVKNICDYVNPLQLNNCEIVDGEFKQIVTDSKTNLNFMASAVRSDGTTYALFTSATITTNGEYLYEFNFPSDAVAIRIGHNGTTRDAKFDINTNHFVVATTYVISINVLNCVQSSGVYRFNKIMICTKQLWDTIGHDFQPLALPNYDLTYLQAEDRAALAEVVDSGAKNLLDFANLTFQASSNVTVNKTDTQITVTTNNNTWGNAAYKMTLSAGTYYYSCKISNLTVASGTRACIVLDSGSDGHGTRIATFDVSTGTVSFPFVWTGGTLYIFYYPGYANTANSNAFTAAENMICTKAAFCISPKFVPYRPSYQALVDKTTEQTFGIFKYNNNYSINTVTRKCNGFAWFTLSATSTANITANTNTIIAYVDGDVQPVGGSTDRFIFTARVNTDPPSLLHSHIRGGDGYIYINSPTAIPAGTSISITGSYKY